MRVLRSAWVVAAIGLCLRGLAAQGQTTVVWTNTSGSWNDPANWSPAVVPDGNFDVLIPSNGIPQFSGDITVNSLTNNGTIDQAGHTLTVSNGFALFSGTCDGTVIQISGASEVVPNGKITGDLVQFAGSIMASNFVVGGNFIKTSGSATIWDADIEGDFYQASGDTAMQGGILGNVTNQSGTLTGNDLAFSGDVYNNGTFSGRYEWYPQSFTQTTNGTFNFFPFIGDFHGPPPIICRNVASLAGTLNIDMGPILTEFSPTDVFGGSLAVIGTESAFSGAFSKVTFQNLAPGMSYLPQRDLALSFLILPTPQMSSIAFSNGQAVLQVGNAWGPLSPGYFFPVVLETSTNMVDWSALATNSVGPENLQITDTNPPSAPLRFYRTRLTYP